MMMDLFSSLMDPDIKVL
jgi:hypothetical protein